MPNTHLNLALDVSTVRMQKNWFAARLYYQLPEFFVLWRFFCSCREKTHSWWLQTKFRTGSSSGLCQMSAFFSLCCWGRAEPLINTVSAHCIWELMRFSWPQKQCSSGVLLCRKAASSWGDGPAKLLLAVPTTLAWFTQAAVLTEQPTGAGQSKPHSWWTCPLLFLVWLSSVTHLGPRDKPLDGSLGSSHVRDVSWS